MTIPCESVSSTECSNIPPTLLPKNCFRQKKYFVKLPFKLPSEEIFVQICILFAVKGYIPSQLRFICRQRIVFEIASYLPPEKILLQIAI